MNNPEHHESRKQPLDEVLEMLGFHDIQEQLASPTEAYQGIAQRHPLNSQEAIEAWSAYTETGEQIIDQFVSPHDKQKRAQAHIALIIYNARILLSIGHRERYIEEIDIATLYAHNVGLDTTALVLLDEIHYYGGNSLLD